MRDWLLLGGVALTCLTASCRETRPALPAPDLTTAAQRFVGLMAGGDDDRAVADFDRVMSRVMSPAKRQEAWKSSTTQAGPFQEQVSAKAARSKGHDIVVVKCRFPEGLLDVRVVYNARGQVSGLWFARADRAGEYRPPPP